MSEPKHGEVKWFNPVKGFGFIGQDRPERDIFVHISAVEQAGLGTLYEGQEITFEVAENHNKRSAVRIKDVATESLDGDNSLALEPLATPASIEMARHCSEEVVRRLQADPRQLHELHPAAFEDLVARIFESEGYTVEMNKAWNQADGGVDIVAVRMDGLVPIRAAIQCKRYSMTNRVTAEPIRSLAGVLDRYKAHAGVLATTGYFTGSAIEEARNYIWRVGLRDYQAIVAGLMKLRL